MLLSRAHQPAFWCASRDTRSPRSEVLRWQALRQSLADSEAAEASCNLVWRKVHCEAPSAAPRWLLAGSSTPLAIEAVALAGHNDATDSTSERVELYDPWKQHTNLRTSRDEGAAIGTGLVEGAVLKIHWDLGRPWQVLAPLPPAASSFAQRCVAGSATGSACVQVG